MSDRPGRAQARTWFDEINHFPQGFKVLMQLFTFAVWLLCALRYCPRRLAPGGLPQISCPNTERVAFFARLFLIQIQWTSTLPVAIVYMPNIVLLMVLLLIIVPHRNSATYYC
jgi:hypothetical protein